MKVLALSYLGLTACATSVESPFKQAALRSDRSICPIRVENGTSVRLHLRYWIALANRGPIGHADPGESVTFGVTCDTDTVVAYGVGPARIGGQPTYREAANVDRREGKETVIKLTLTDEMR